MSGEVPVAALGLVAALVVMQEAALRWPAAVVEVCPDSSMHAVG